MTQNLTLEALTKILSTTTFNDKVIDVSDLFIESNIHSFFHEMEQSNVIFYILRNEINKSTLDQLDKTNDVYLLHKGRCVCLPLEVDDCTIKIIQELIL